MSSLTTTDRLKKLLPQLFNTQKLAGNYYLRFQLTSEVSGLIDLKYVRESLTISGDRITAVPNLPEYVIGLMGSRNQVFLALDLAHLAGMTPETVNLRQYQVMVVKIDSTEDSEQLDINPEERSNLYGLAVRKIEGIERILPENFIFKSNNVPENLRPFIKNTVLQKSDDASSVTEDRYSFLIDIEQLISNRVQE